MLVRWGHDVAVAKDGTEAWEALQTDPCPRIAILDWNMPGMVGIDICTRLKAKRGGEYVYTILITHGSDEDAAQVALDSGADDFLRKPLDLKELRSRVGVGLRVVEYDDRVREKTRELERYTTQLEEIAASRARQLAHAERMVTLGMLSAGMAHEINNPSTFISGNAQTIRRFWNDAAPWLQIYAATADAKEQRKIAFMLDELPKSLDGIQSGVKRIAKIVRGLKAYSGQNRTECSDCDVNRCVQSALELCNYELQKGGTRVQCVFDEVPVVRADAQQLEQVLVNLLVNASHAMGQCATKRVTVRSKREGEQIELTVSDSGPGIPHELVEKIFDPFFTTKPAGKGTGLGLSICRDIVRAHDGDLSVANLPEGGAQFRILLPLQKGVTS